MKSIIAIAFATIAILPLAKAAKAQVYGTNIPCSNTACTASSINLTGSTPPSNGWYLSSANTLAASVNGVLVTNFVTSGQTIVGKITLLATAATTTNSVTAQGSTTSANYFSITNTGGGATFGIEQSTGGAFFSGSTAYATVLGTTNSTPVQIFTNNSLTATFGTDQSVTLAAGVVLTAPGSDSGLTDASLCRVVSTGAVKTGTGTLGICLGTSTILAKTGVKPLPLIESLWRILRSQPVSYRYKSGFGDNGARIQYGFIAEWAVSTFPELVGHDSQGKINSFDMLGMFAWLVRAFQALFIWNAMVTALLALLIIKGLRRGE